MNKAIWTLVVASIPLLSIATFSQQQPTGADKPWAFPLKIEKEFPASPGPKSLPGSTRQYTEEQIDGNEAPDWYPDKHPPAPDIVVKGRPEVRACGSCHLMSGIGHPESSDLTGLSAEYITQQMADFKSGARIDPTRMNGIAKATTDAEVKAAAAWFASLPRIPSTKVVEAAMVPKTYLGNGRMRFAEPGGAMEPIGNRIITVPENVERTRLRDPFGSTMIAYVPPGSLAKGKELVETGGGKTISCTTCHGVDLKGAGNIPRLAGVHPIYTVRQLYWFKDGTRNGADAGLMKPAAEPLTDEDIVNAAAYLASLQP